jgi:hypothetical protein
MGRYGAAARHRCRLRALPELNPQEDPMRLSYLTAILLGAALIAPAQAVQVAGVNVDDSATVGATPLVLNGAGIRHKYWVKVYVGALYLPKKAHGVDAVLANTGPNRVLMHFLYKNVTSKEMTDGWNEGFRDNSKAEIDKLQPRIDDFNKMFDSNFKTGDVVLLDYLPGEGTQVTIKGQVKGTIPGADFNTALLKIWIGPVPPDAGLKKAMIGG